MKGERDDLLCKVNGRPLVVSGIYVYRGERKGLYFLKSLNTAS